MESSTSATRHTFASLVVLVALITQTVAGIHEPTEAPPERHAEPQPVRTVRVPGTVIEFQLVPVPKLTPEPGQVPSKDAPGVLWVLTTEVTWDLYDIYLYALDIPDGEAEGADAVARPSKPYVPPDRGMGHAGFPAMGMTRRAAEMFCAWLSRKTGLAVRLPTPAEFQWYAEAPPTKTDDAAPDADAPTAAAWTRANSNRKTHPVATCLPNRLGVRGALGNVAEWVATEGKPVAMGGSYRDPPDACTPRSVQRQTSAWNMSDPQIPKSRWWLADCSWVGFRFVVEEKPDDTQPEPAE